MKGNVTPSRHFIITTALTAVLLAGCTARSGPSGISPAGDRGFSPMETPHATILAEQGVDEASARAVGQMFEIGYQVVAADLDESRQRPRLYVYFSEPRMYQDLISRWGYPGWVRAVRTVPRMHRDYIEWIPPQRCQDAAFITHEYAHRIIEQIAGRGSQVSFKWFDEGLAEYEGQKALELWSPAEAAWRRAPHNLSGTAALTSQSLIPFKDITTESQWSAQIERGAQLAQNEASAAVVFLISQHGVGDARAVLKLIGTGRSFRDSFRTIYGFSVEEFENAFRLILPLPNPRQAVW